MKTARVFSGSVRGPRCSPTRGRWPSDSPEGAAAKTREKGGSGQGAAAPTGLSDDIAYVMPRNDLPQWALASHWRGWFLSRCGSLLSFTQLRAEKNIADVAADELAYGLRLEYWHDLRIFLIADIGRQ